MRLGEQTFRKGKNGKEQKRTEGRKKEGKKGENISNSGTREASSYLFEQSTTVGARLQKPPLPPSLHTWTCVKAQTTSPPGEANENNRLRLRTGTDYRCRNDLRGQPSVHADAFLPFDPLAPSF
jgi:hypothetical protein